MPPTVPDMPLRDAPQIPLIVYTVLMCVITLGFLVYWLASAERRRNPSLPLLMLGGALSGLMEPWLDNVVLVGYPVDQATPYFVAFERPVPIFVVIGYAWFCGGLLFVLYRLFQREFSARSIWQLYGVVVVVDFVAIGLSAWLGILEFFGDPPLKIARFPLWWAGIDGLMVVMGGVLAFFLVDRLRGLQRLWLVLIPSITLGAAAGIVGWPVSTAINSGWPMWAKVGCALCSIALSLASVHFIAKVAPRVADGAFPQPNSEQDRAIPSAM